MYPELESILRGTGMSPREIRLTDLDAIINTPKSNGFGLVGPTGVGKTVAIAKDLAGWADRYASEGRLAPYNFAMWINWPDMAERLKSMTGPADSEQLWDLLDRMKTCRVLYLDDIGQERIRGEDDFSLGHLRVILDHRYRAEKGVIWTSNLDPDGLSAIYGARTISRMIQAWPPIVVNGADRRMS